MTISARTTARAPAQHGTRRPPLRWLAVATVTVAVAAPVGVAHADDPLGPLRHEVAAGRFASARAILGRLPDPLRARPELRYLEGRLLEDTGDFAAAVAAYGSTPESGLPADVYREMERRRASLLPRLGRCQEARPLLLTHGRDRGPAGALPRAQAAECALVLGDLDAATAELEAVVQEDAKAVDTFAAGLQLAEAQHRHARSAAAVETLRRLLVQRPEHAEIDSVRRQLAALGASAELGPRESLDRAERLSSVRRHREAAAVLEALGSPRDRALRGRWLHLHGMALFGTRRAYAEAAQVLARAARRGSPEPVEDAFHAARALSRAGRDRAAIRAYERLAVQHPRTRRAAQARYLSAWLGLRSGRGDGAMRRFLASRSGRRSQWATAALWDLALHAFERRRYDQAQSLFSRYAERGAGAMVRGRGLYWLGRAKQLAGHRRDATRAYRDALSVDPLHWYGVLAAGRLAELGAPPGPALGGPPPARPDISVDWSRLPEDARFYARLGLRDDASRALARQEAAVPDPAQLAAAYLELGAYQQARGLARRATALLSARPDAGSLWAWRTAYPRAFEAAVVPAAAAARVPPELVWSLMRQESGYDPGAVSYADAIGLLQMLPETAARVGQGLGAVVERDMLFEPRINVTLGVHHIGELVARYGGAFPLALAAYNAGAHRVDEWLARSGPMELDLFVERIPFDQTRNYVRRVTSHLARYHYLGGNEAQWLRLPSHVQPP